VIRTDIWEMIDLSNFKCTIYYDGTEQYSIHFSQQCSML
jgi:hypothetical protein